MDDSLAGAITAILLVPQSLAYALLAGLPPQAGLYASMLPPILYAIFGTSRTLAVGPVAVAALLVASTLGARGVTDPAQALMQAVILAFEVGLLLLALGLLRAGRLINFLSHPVLSGFTTGAALVIVVSQIKHLTGIPATGQEAPALLAQLLGGIDQIKPVTLMLGLGTMGILWFSGAPLGRLLQHLHVSERAALLLGTSAPLAVVLGGTALVIWGGWDVDHGVAVVGTLAVGLPHIDLSFLGNASLWLDLLPAAALIALIGYVESVSIAKILASRRRQRGDPDQELIALGVANLGAALTGAMPVAGGFSRTVVNDTAGARTPLAGVFTAILVGVAALHLGPLFAHMPQAILAAIIVVAVLNLVDVAALRHAWRYDRTDAGTLLATLAGVVVLGVERGLLLGLVLSLLLFIWRAGHPHIARLGQVPGTAHFRNIQRHSVETWPHILLVRIDESLCFANAEAVEDFILQSVREEPETRDVVLIASAVNAIDTSALHMLLSLLQTLRTLGVTLHLAEVKGPVMDRLQRVDLAGRLAPGRIFLHTAEAVQCLMSPAAACPDSSRWMDQERA
jgi:SulP family sulfate permease